MGWSGAAVWVLVLVDKTRAEEESRVLGGDTRGYTIVQQVKKRDRAVGKGQARPMLQRAVVQ